MIRGALLAACVALCAATSTASMSDWTQTSPNVEHALSTRDLMMAGGLAGVTTYEDVLVRRLESMATTTASDEALRAQAQILFKLYKALNAKEVAASGKTEAEQFEVFYKTMFQQILARVNASKPTTTPTTTTKTPTSTTKAPTSTTKSPTSTTKAPTSTTKAPTSTATPKPTKTKKKVAKYAATKTTNWTEIAESLSFLTEVYDEELAAKVRALQDNTQNIEAIVQSTKTGEKDDPANQFQAPTVLEGTDEGPTSLDGSGEGRRLDATTSGAPPVQVLFCDVGGNAIWKWSHTPYDPNAPINQTTTVNVLTPKSLCESPKVEVKVTTYQSGCSRQNHPEGCDNVYWKGCGGLTVNRASNRIVVARTGGRSLGLLFYKNKGDQCQGRVVDAITHYKGKRFNSISATEYSPSGNLYFTDSPFGLATGPADFEGDILDKSPLRELPFNGVFLMKNGSTKLDLLECGMDRPNKIAFSPKGDVMYITNSRKGNSYVKQFNLASDGLVDSSKIFFNFTAHPELDTDKGYADGIKTDDQGNVYVASYTGVFIFSPAGELIGNMRSNQPVNGVALGGGRMFLSGAFGVVAQATGVVPSIPLPSAKTDC